MATSSAVESRKPPPRPSFGKNGRPITVYANHYQIKFHNDESIIHYDVQTNPELKIKEELRNIFNILLSSNPQNFGRATLAFDSVRNIYSSKKLSGITTEGKTFTIDREMRSGKMQSVKITLKEVQLIQLTDLNRALQGYADVPYQALQAVDVILRWSLTKKFTMVYRSFYPQPSRDDYKSLGRGHESWRGFYQSARPSQTGLSLNIDTAHSAFYEELSVDDFLVQYFNDNNLTSLRRDQSSQFASELKGVKIVNIHGDKKRKYRITDVSSRKPSEITFEYQGKTVNVTQYLKTTYNYTMKYPDLPCLKLNNKDIYLPMELCKIVPGQYYKKKINEFETANMVKFAAIPANQRKEKIDRFVKEINNYSRDEVARGFNIQVDGNMKRVDARVLDPVDVIYRNQVTKPRDGSWNLQNIKFVESPIVNSWGCIWVRDRGVNVNKVEKLLNDLKKSTEDCGIQGISERSLIDKPRNVRDANECGKVIRELQRKSGGKGLDFILCIIPGNRPEYYHTIKTVADLDYQLPTQCIQTKNVDRANRQFLANVALKINAKLGGTNNKVSQSKILSKPTIVFGADVTHPGIGDQTSPSIAAIVGSADKMMSHYFHAIRIQDHRQEIIADLESVVQKMLTSFYDRNVVWPERILFYRDGVSEGQFNAVIREELTAIERACKAVNEKYRPKITFLVVQKRHHTRFFPASKRDEVGKARNVPPGLVVDRTVCHPSEFDFYLCSHFGIQGTSRPTHYHILLDESKIPPDVLQEFTYQLCHVYCRCTRSVSIPAPVYYSHHLAFRARSYLVQLSKPKEEKKDHVLTPKEINTKINKALAQNKLASVFFA